MRTPLASPNVRLETGFVQGDQISVHYDPMISKLIVHGENRNDALRRFRRALEQYQVVGLNTNIAFIKTVAEHPAFIQGEVETGFIEEFHKDLFKEPGAPDATTLALAASALRLKEIDNIKKCSQGLFALKKSSRIIKKKKTYMYEIQILIALGVLIKIHSVLIILITAHFP